MKKLLLLLGAGLLAALLLVSGCGTDPAPPAQENPGQHDVQPGEDNENTQYPEQVTRWLNTFKPLFAADYLEIDGKTYFMVSWGEQRTGGYSVTINDIEETDDTVVVTVTFAAPEPGAVTTEALTYPQAVAVWDKVSDKTIRFEAAGDENLMSQVVGLQQELSSLEKYNSVIAAGTPIVEDGHLHLTGLARVFEATLNYQFLDNTGNVLAQGTITAATAGPDWGAFEVDAPVPEQAVRFQLLNFSMKDGSKENVLEFSLEK